MRRLVALALSALAALALASCTDLQSAAPLASFAPAAPRITPEPVASDMPRLRFDGPYANAFAAAWEQSGSQTVRDALGDGHISDEEYERIIDLFGRCLAGEGVELLSYEGGEVQVPDDGADGQKNLGALADCSRLSAEHFFTVMYELQQGDNDRLRKAEMNGPIVACLIRNRAVQPSYSVEQFEAESNVSMLPTFDAYSFVTDVGVSILEECFADATYRGNG